MEKYGVIWKGEEVARLSRAQIREEFDRGTFGFLHSVKVGRDRVVGISEFLNGADSAGGGGEISGPALGDFDFHLFGFVLCGLSFLSPYVFMALAVYCVFLFFSKRVRLSGLLFSLGALMAFAGYFFFNSVFPSI